jgi:hypothetical protein
LKGDPSQFNLVTPYYYHQKYGVNVRVGMQYTGYTQFNGANRDELIGTSDRKPGDNNVFSVFFWGAY